MTNQNTNKPVGSGFGIGCYNCNGLGNSNKRELVLKWLEDKDDDIFFLQETHTTPEIEQAWKSAWDGSIFFNHESLNSTGVAVLFKGALAAF